MASTDKPPFVESEFVCHCGCGQVHLSPRLIPTLILIREKFGHPMIIESGYRCPSWNALVSASGGKEHVNGEAADVLCTSDFLRFSLLAACFAVGIRRIGIDPTSIHIGISLTLPQRGVWIYPKKEDPMAELPTGSIDIALNLLYALYQSLHKTDLEKFEEEWKNDRQKFYKALQDGDADTINQLDAKYRQPLL